MTKKYIVIWEEEEEEDSGYSYSDLRHCVCINYEVALKKAKSVMDRGHTAVKVCEVKAEIVLSKKLVEY